MCNCSEGYLLNEDGFTCDGNALLYIYSFSSYIQCTAINLDINECDLNMSMCQPDSYCNNTIGSYLCICNVGYSGDGFINCTSKTNTA